MTGPLTIDCGWPQPKLWPNSRTHPMSLHSARKRAKDEAFWVTRAVLPLGWQHDGGRLKFTITAHPAVRRIRDDDGLIGACKGHRDGIALALKIDDSLFDLQPVVWGEKQNAGRIIFTVES